MHHLQNNDVNFNAGSLMFPQELITQVGLDPVHDASQEERVRQYAAVSLQAELLEKGWCTLVPQLLESTEHDNREKVCLQY